MRVHNGLSNRETLTRAFKVVPSFQMDKWKFPYCVSTISNNLVLFEYYGTITIIDVYYMQTSLIYIYTLNDWPPCNEDSTFCIFGYKHLA